MRAMLVARRLFSASFAAAIVAAAVAATEAGAATITTTIPCVANLGFGGALTLPLAGSGFTPNASVAIRTSSPSDPVVRDLTTVRADGAGNVPTTRLDPPSLRSASTVEQVFTLVATDLANPANTATATFTQVRFGFDAKPSTGRPTRKVTYTARGFLPGKPVFAHFRFGGITRRDVRLGVASSPCGIVSRKMRLLPTKTRFGTWTVYMDQIPTYSKKTILQAKGTLFIRRTLT
jgi:hypothetical protein